MKKILTLLALCAASCTPLPAQNTLAGNLTVQQSVKLTGAASPATITSSVNDYAPAGFSTAAVLRLQSDVPRTITGLAGGVAGRMVWLTNVGAHTISLATESALSMAANRFAFGASGFDLPAGGSLSIWYDTTSSRWRSATNLAAGGGGTSIDQTARDAAAAAQATADSKQAALANAATLEKVSESAGLPLWDGAAWPGGGSGGSGTVTSVSVVPANGVSGSVATASTTPAITLSLGAIAPTSVAASGTVTGSNLSGTNTGDQTSVMGNAGTATKLATARAINGVSFDGTANITVPAAAGTLTGTTLASGVTASSLTSAAGGSFGTAAFTAATAYDSAGAAAAITLAGLGGVPTSRTVNGHALSDNVTVTPSDLSLAIGTNTQAWSAKLDTVAALAAATGWLHNDGAGVLTWSTPSKSDLGLGSVENAALSTWTGSANLSTVGTISSGTWHGTALADTYIASAAAWNAKVSFPGFGTTGTTVAVGNDSRLSDARTPTAHNQAWSTITSTPTTLSGYGITDAQGLDTDLTALAGLSTTGIVARTGAGAASTRTITGTTDQVVVTSGDGVSGNPTLALPQSIATTSTPQFAKIGVGGAADASAALLIDGGTGALPAPVQTPIIRVSHADASTPMMEFLGFGGNGLQFLGRASEGTRAAPTATANSRALVTFGGAGYDGTAWTLNKGTFTIAADGLWSGTNNGTYINWTGTPNGSTTAAEWMRLANGSLSIGSTSATTANKLFVYSTDTSRVLFSGTTKGIRFTHNTTGSVVEGVDSTGSVSYQPLYLGGSYVATSISGTEKMRLDGTGLGIGTTSPATLLHVGASSGVWNGGAGRVGIIAGPNAAGGTLSVVSTTALAADNGGSISFGGFYDSNVVVDFAGVVGAKENATSGNTAGCLRLRTRPHAGNMTDQVGVSSVGALRLFAYGAGTLVTDSSGNVTASSDRRLKNVSGKFTRGLDAILQIQPKVFTWKPESGMNPDDVNVGFIAQDVQPAIPEAVGSMKTVDTEEDDGTGKKVKKSKREAAEYLTLSDRPIIAALVNAVKELKAENDDLRARVSALENRKATK